ncbi:aminotransferase class I/II-fold pyridoxal phosphate-dependent enzyme, partial [Erysipelotrichaceae bacterium OttesenSCG-928-M19]|nr:aminotransferase class I/II-fold pyridoxal phosphate-dependent enzyme [Erysipelotrichaceae bacterium OttesenSCG-928-M19]
KMKIPYGRQEILDEDIEAVISTLKAELITQGPMVEEFEESIARYHNVKHAIAFSNGTTALHAAYYALGVREGDEIISPAMTFVASSNGGVYCGATPVLVDIDLETNCIDINQIEAAITDKTKTICAVSLAGYPVDLKKVREIADKHNLHVIHDGAHAIGARREGSFNLDNADFTMFSFHPVKHITTGEGGMLLTNSDMFAKNARLFRTHGITKVKEEMNIYEGPWSYEMIDEGNNYRLNDFQCALGYSQFKRIEKNLKRRNLIAKRYNEAFSQCADIIIPPHFDLSNFSETTDVKTIANLNSYHLYTLRLKDNSQRLDFYNYLKENGIFAQIHYIPISWFKFYQDNYGYKKTDFKNANEYYESEVSLPMYHALTDEEQEYVIKVVLDYFK